MSTGIEKLKRSETRIITQGSTGVFPTPPGTSALFIMATLHIYNTTDTSALTQTGVVSSPAIGTGKAIIKDTSVDVCWCADVSRNFSAVNVTNEALPVVTDQLLAISVSGLNQGLALDGTVVYLIAGGSGASASWLDVINGTDPSNLLVTTSYNMDTAFAITQRFPKAIAGYPTTHRLYIVNASSGIDTRFIVYNASTPAAVAQQGSLTLVVAPAFSQACALAINYPTVYAIIGGNGTSIAAVLKIIDVSDPTTPSVLSTTTIGLVTDLMRTIQVNGTTLCIGGATLNDDPSAASKVLVYDVSNGAAPSLSSTIILTGLTQPITAMFFRTPTLYVGAKGDGEASARFAVYDTTSGLQLGSEYTFAPAAVGALAITGEP
jgi:hypothetical protein